MWRKMIWQSNIRKSFGPVCATLLIALSTAAFEARAQTGTKQCVDSGPFGSLLNSHEFDASVQALPPAAFLNPPVQPPLPTQAFLDNLPAVSQQGTAANPGSPGSCEAQSFGYGLGSYTAARHADGTPKWNPALAQNSVSPAYLYELEHTIEGRTCPKGSLALGYLSQLIAFGAPTRDRVPYEPDCAYLDAIPAQHDFPQDYPEMQRFRIGSYAAFHIDSDPSSAVEMIKEYIANGQAVAFSGSVLCGYGKNLQLQDGVIYETSIMPMSGHGQLVVGYDDNVGTPGKTGALLIQNSFGTDWPPASAGLSAAPPGMAYWSYDTFKKTQKLAAVAYPRATAPTGVKLKGSKHPAVASITRAFQWAPDGQPGVYLVLTHFFHDLMFLNSVALTEPGPGHTTATAEYKQYISTGYSYLKRTDSNAFLAGTYAVTLGGHDVAGNPVTYTGSVEVGTPHPDMPPGKSMAGQIITGSTGVAAALSP
ncbi:MAG TPA: C1 family peptidase [Candidatus Binataceae bacterium]|nr:C1 family peptidase [Candidatus Binataceae bacterium]